MAGGGNKNEQIYGGRKVLNLQNIGEGGVISIHIILGLMDKIKESKGSSPHQYKNKAVKQAFE